MRHRDFGEPVPESEGQESEPLTFTLRGERFECYAEVPGAVLLDYSEEMGTRDSAHQAAAIKTLFREAMPEPEHERFDKFIRLRENRIDIDLLLPLSRWLVEEYGANRPTKRSSDSSDGPEQTGTTAEGE